MARLTGSYFCRSIFLPVLPDGCLVSIFPSVIVLFLWIFLFQTGTNAAEPHKNAFGAAVVNYHRCGLNCNLFNADFPASSAERAESRCSCQLTIFLPEVRPEFRSIPVNARRTVPRVPEGALPVAKVGPRESETSAGHRCGPDLQGIGVLHHRLPKRFVQRSCQNGISRHSAW